MSDLAKALALLPHGKDFRFVDNLTKLDPGKTGTGSYLVRGDEPFLRGHFPGHPIFPGVLAVEAIAQLAGVVAQSDPKITPLLGMKLTSIHGAKIRGTAKPGETIFLEATILGRMGNLIQAKGVARIGENIILMTELVLSGDSPEAKPV
jgi:3-hydroxyacyl-[acyl-carrier-protein] dehydratase